MRISLFGNYFGRVFGAVWGGGGVKVDMGMTRFVGL